MKQTQRIKLYGLGFLDPFYWIEHYLTLYAAGGKSSGSSQQDTTMARTGDTSTTQSVQLPEGINNRLNRMVTRVESSNDFPIFRFKDLMNKNEPGTPALENTAKLDSTTSTYEADTNAAFDNRLQRALAVSRTGEANVLAPVAQGQSFREADATQQQLNSRQQEIEQQKMMDFRKLIESAGHFVNMVNLGATGQSRHGVNDAGILTAAAQQQGKPQSDSHEALTGKGFQETSAQSRQMNAGVTCCFIFLEAYNGTLPWWVRKARDEHAPKDTARRNGYVKMSKWLVPLMQRSRVVRFLANTLMVQPMTKCGGWKNNVKGYEHGWIYQPFVILWFKIWKQYGGKI